MNIGEGGRKTPNDGQGKRGKALAGGDVRKASTMPAKKGAVQGPTLSASKAKGR